MRIKSFLLSLVIMSLVSFGGASSKRECVSEEQDNICSEKQEKRQKAVLQRNDILSYVNANDDMISESFICAYVDEEGNLFITLSSREVEESYRDLFKLNHAFFSEGQGSYKERQDVYQKINKKISDLQHKSNEKRTNQAEEKLIKHFPRCSYDDTNNKIKVVFRSIDLQEAEELFCQLIGDFIDIEFSTDDDYKPMKLYTYE